MENRTMNASSNLRNNSARRTYVLLLRMTDRRVAHAVAQLHALYSPRIRVLLYDNPLTAEFHRVYDEWSAQLDAVNAAAMADRHWLRLSLMKGALAPPEPVYAPKTAAVRAAALDAGCTVRELPLFRLADDYIVDTQLLAAFGGACCA
jgi:hypothetical protein